MTSPATTAWILKRTRAFVREQVDNLRDKRTLAPDVPFEFEDDVTSIVQRRKAADPNHEMTMGEIVDELIGEL